MILERKEWNILQEDRENKKLEIKETLKKKGGWDLNLVSNLVREREREKYR